MTEKKKAIFKLQTISREKPNLYLMNDKDEVALEVKVYLEKTNTLEIIFKKGLFSNQPQTIFEFILFLFWAILLSIPFLIYAS